MRCRLSAFSDNNNALRGCRAPCHHHRELNRS
nr:MAG TPA: hypothetical protein [Caudoviricetes sp.]